MIIIIEKTLRLNTWFLFWIRWFLKMKLCTIYLLLAVVGELQTFKLEKSLLDKCTSEFERSKSYLEDFSNTTKELLSSLEDFQKEIHVDFFSHQNDLLDVFKRFNIIARDENCSSETNSSKVNFSREPKCLVKEFEKIINKRDCESVTKCKHIVLDPDRIVNYRQYYFQYNALIFPLLRFRYDSTIALYKIEARMTQDTIDFKLKREQCKEDSNLSKCFDALVFWADEKAIIYREAQVYVTDLFKKLTPLIENLLEDISKLKREYTDKLIGKLDEYSLCVENDI